MGTLSGMGCLLDDDRRCPGLRRISGGVRRESAVPVEPLVPRGGERVVVVGGANTDFVGVPFSRLLDRDSNPGTISVSAGGVGRNIAENLARLGVETHLISAFGYDYNSRELLETTRKAGVRTENSLIADDMHGATYIAINDERHDLAVAVNDMRVLDRITPELLDHPARRRLLDTASVVVLDANLPEPTLEWLAANVAAPIAVDPVSVAKSRRIKPLLPRLALIKPNGHEAAELLGMRDVTDLRHAEKAARGLVEAGVERALVTPGRAGVAWADRTDSGVLEPPELEPVNTSGAGDAFAAGLVYAMLAEADTATMARFASALSIMAIASEETVNPSTTREVALELYQELYS